MKTLQLTLELVRAAEQRSEERGAGPRWKEGRREEEGGGSRGGDHVGSALVRVLHLTPHTKALHVH